MRSERFGDESWELDALNPETLTALIGDEMEGLVDREAWKETKSRRDEGRRKLAAVSERWKELTSGI